MARSGAVVPDANLCRLHGLLVSRKLLTKYAKHLDLQRTVQSNHGFDNCAMCVNGDKNDVGLFHAKSNWMITSVLSSHEY